MTSGVAESTIRSVDGGLRAYLEKPPPRPPLQDGRYTDRRMLWLFPLGAALTFSLIASQVLWDHRDRWAPGALVWVALVVSSTVLGRAAHGLTQSYFRHGIFTAARVTAVRLFVARLEFRRYRRDSEAPFERGAEFPALVAAKVGGGAKIFVGDEVVEAGETKGSMAALEEGRAS